MVSHNKRLAVVPSGLCGAITVVYESETWLRISLALAPRCWKMILAAVNLPLCSWAKCSLDGCNQKSNSVREREFCKNKQIKICHIEFFVMHCEHDKH